MLYGRRQLLLLLQSGFKQLLLERLTDKFHLLQHFVCSLFSADRRLWKVYSTKGAGHFSFRRAFKKSYFEKIFLINFISVYSNLLHHLICGHRLLIEAYKQGTLRKELIFTTFPVGKQYCGDIGFLLDLHRDIDRLRSEIEVTSLYDIFFQHQP